LAGLAVALYLTLFQAKVVSTVWDAFRAGDSAWILRRSPLVRWLGFPDALFGVAAYGTELALDLAAVGRQGDDHRRWRLAFGALTAAMALGSVGLVVAQAVYGRWCSLCLASAALSIVIFALAAPEVATAARQVGNRNRTTERRSSWPESSSSLGLPPA
jgi:uncharacterized membrane protein